jgi:hypothetical protein
MNNLIIITSLYLSIFLIDVPFQSSISEIFIIGNDINSEDYNIFRSPQEIHVDSQNNFYVRDENSAEIKVFNPQGKYLRTIGGKGKGPGEFLDISCITINNEDELIVFDRELWRLTGYKTYGIDCHIYNDFKIGELYFIQQLNKNEYITRNFTEHSVSKNVFSVYSADFTTIYYTFGETSLFADRDDKFLSAYNYMNHYTLVVDSLNVITSNVLYDGYIIWFTKREDGWTSKEVEGSESEMKSYTAGTEKSIMKRLDSKDGKTRLMMSGPTGTFYNIINNAGAGLHFYKNHKLNFILTTKRDGCKFSVDIFKLSKEFVVNHVLEDYKKSVPLLSTKVLCVDNENYFYLTLHEQGMPSIKKIKLNIGL